MSFGENIKSIRRKKKISIRELSELTGLSKSTLSDIENNISKNPTLDTLEKISTILGVTIMELVNSPPDKAMADGPQTNEQPSISFAKSIQVTGQDIDMELENIYIPESSPVHEYIQRLGRVSRRFKDSTERAKKSSPETMEAICDFIDFMLQKDEKEKNA